VTGKCPGCGKPRDEKFKPFCSKRCADVDLGRWLNGGYAIPVEEGGGPEDAFDDAPAAPGPFPPKN
jgi:hypothetical protein